MSGQELELASSTEQESSSSEESSSSDVHDLISRISAITSPDDLEVSTLAAEIKSSVNEEEDLKCFVTELCNMALDQRELTSVAGALCGHAGLHQVGEIRLRTILLQRLQKDFEERRALESTDRTRFVTSAMFLGEIFYYLKSDTGTPLKVLADPVITYLTMILKTHLKSDPAPDINEEMNVVAKQLLQNGETLYQLVPKGIEDVVRDVTEVMIRHTLSNLSRLNLLAALSEVWPLINESTNPRTVHASLAAKLGLSLNI